MSLSSNLYPLGVCWSSEPRCVDGPLVYSWGLVATGRLLSVGVRVGMSVEPSSLKHGIIAVRMNHSLLHLLSYIAECVVCSFVHAAACLCSTVALVLLGALGAAMPNIFGSMMQRNIVQAVRAVIAAATVVCPPAPGGVHLRPPHARDSSSHKAPTTDRKAIGAAC
eukprot:GHUV01047508.1.p1 GENE.GHUV01047508.1~~GHUV01047508.1.p1  ORF type:complete len:166 (+),score=37.15 GHUV01047508.1:99-596(+)